MFIDITYTLNVLTGPAQLKTILILLQKLKKPEIFLNGSESLFFRLYSRHACELTEWGTT